MLCTDGLMLFYFIIPMVANSTCNERDAGRRGWYDYPTQQPEQVTISTTIDGRFAVTYREAIGMTCTNRECLIFHRSG